MPTWTFIGPATTRAARETVRVTTRQPAIMGLFIAYSFDWFLFLDVLLRSDRLM
jgi:hypothetical protein